MRHAVGLIAVQFRELPGVLFRIGEVRRQKVFLAASANSIQRRPDAPATVADCVAARAVELLKQCVSLLALRRRGLRLVTRRLNDIG